MNLPALEAPFRIARRFPSGNLKDWTIYKLRPATIRLRPKVAWQQ
jgi:hypothetical protein